MSNPNRPRKTTVSRGKKSDKKREKRLKQSEEIDLASNHDLGKVFAKAEENRKDLLINNNLTNTDKEVLFDPSPKFYEDTDQIRNINIKYDEVIININTTNFETGINDWETKQERKLVLNGKKSKVFNRLQNVLRQRKNEILQEKRKVRDSIIRITKEREAKHLAAIELEKQQEIARLAEQENREIARLAAIELEKQQEIARLAEQESQETARLAEKDQAELQRVEISVEKKKLGMWTKIFKSLLSIISIKGKKSRQLRPRTKQLEVTSSRLKTAKKGDHKIQLATEIAIETTIEEPDIVAEEEEPEAIIEEEKPVVEVVTEIAIETTIEEPDIVAEEGEPEAIIEEVQPEVAIVEEEKPVVEVVTEIAIETTIDEPEIVTEEEEPEAIIEEVQPGVAIVEEIETITEIVIETTIDEPEIVAEEEEPEAVIEDEPEILTEEEEPEVIIEEGQSNVAIVEGGLLAESPELADTDVMAGVNILPVIESGEIILADMRILMREEPDPISSMIKILKEEHNLLQSDVESVINHIVSPISICDVLTEDNYESFIQSLYDNGDNIDEGLEIWTQVIQLIGPSELSSEEKVDIYNIFTSEQNHTPIRKQVITIALLLNALPEKFEKWWKKDMIPKDMSGKYEGDYKHVLGKKIPQRVFDDARRLVCACAIEKPKFISKEYSFHKFKGGMIYEDKAEKWLNDCHTGMNYLTQTEIAGRVNERYGGRIIKQFMTPDILLEVPIQLCEGGGAIHWIDAKNDFVDPALSPDERIGKICSQMNKYVKHYGPGLMIWGKNFSQEWNVATEGAVQHIKV